MRMGADKAFLDWLGRPLWRHQIDTLRRCGGEELFVCGREGQVFPGEKVLLDRVAEQGPLAGLARALEVSNQPQVLVLAVDLPEMTAAFLRERVLAAANDGIGAVPWLDRFHEPLAAVYPRRMLGLVQEQLGEADRSLRTLCRRGEAAGFLRRIEVAAEERVLFRNLNSPEDLPA
jgi:molybdenum cofactor guanylyltransferase